MTNQDTEILFFDRYPRPQPVRNPDDWRFDDEDSNEERELREVAVLGEN